MLGKLLKHEFKATGRHFLLMYAAFAIITIFNKICLEITSSNRFWSIFENLLAVVYILTCAVIFIMTTVLIITRFYKNLTSDEGYLMFTLPVTAKQHIISKGLVAYIWSILSFVIFLLSVLLLAAGHGLGEVFTNINDFIDQAFSYCGSQLWQLIIIYSISIIISGFYNILQYYMAISIGQLVNKHRVLASFGAYFGINFVIQNIMSFGLVFLNLFEPDFPMDGTTDMFISFFLKYMNTVGIISLIVSIVLGIAFFFATDYILSKKLNLE